MKDISLKAYDTMAELISDQQQVVIVDKDGHKIKINYSERDRLIQEGKLLLRKIPKFENCKINIEELSRNYDIFVKAYERANFCDREKLYIDVRTLLERTKTSYISPAIYINEYLDSLIDYNLNLVNYKDLLKEQIFLERCNVYFNSVIISVKTLLDRMCPILSFYYPGISLESTFGREKSDGKYKGLMSVIAERKDSDQLMRMIFELYEDNLKHLIKPRDTVIHYNDMTSELSYTTDSIVILKHYNFKIFQYNDIDPDDFYYYKDMTSSILELYKIFNVMLVDLSKRKVVYRNSHFKDKRQIMSELTKE